jgi:hypothetical protein
VWPHWLAQLLQTLAWRCWLRPGSLLACIWCAAGLRHDDAAGEVADRYMSRRRVRLINLLSGQFESERRWSSDMIFVSLLALGFAAVRFLSG